VETPSWPLGTSRTTAVALALVMVHGKGGSRTNEQNGRNDELLAALHQLGFTLLAIDLRGHGQSSSARFSFGVHESRDVLGGVDYLASQGFAKAQIGLHGVSMGAASVLIAAAQDPTVPALIADCGYADFGRVLRREWTPRTHLPMWVMPASQIVGRLWLGTDMTTVRPIEHIPQIKSRVLFIHAEKDSLIPPTDSQEMAALAAGLYRCGFSPVPSTPQASTQTPRRYTRHVADFFDPDLCAISVPTDPLRFA
jgi:pimeloyl-ACP methyl ester carboxylesterase